MKDFLSEAEEIAIVISKDSICTLKEGKGIYTRGVEAEVPYLEEIKVKSPISFRS
jgi:hypothetical protein